MSFKKVTNILFLNVKHILLFIIAICLNSCNNTPKKPINKTTKTLQFKASNDQLTNAFIWAKEKALSYAHDGQDAVGYWYEAALPNREAFCMRDVSHQAIGAEILGLGKHNLNMFLKFAQNISKEKDYCTYWEINRYNKPAPEDYKSDHDFWYNLPANFDVIFNAYRLYNWTGNKAYLENKDLTNFYQLSLKEYVDRWSLDADKIVNRDRLMHLSNNLEATKFKKSRGIPTYNEGGKAATLLGIDMTAATIAAYKSYAEMLKLTGDIAQSKHYDKKAKETQNFLDTFWWDNEKQAYRSIYYEDKSFDYFMVGDDQAFLHYLLYFNALSDPNKLKNIVDQYEQNFDKIIVELKSYLPIIFYENGYTEIANNMVISLCSKENKRRDYPENSFTIIEHLTRGLMGINTNAPANTFSTLSRLDNENEWVEIQNVPLLTNKVSVKHYGTSKSVASNESGEPITWQAKISGIHQFLYVNGNKTKCHTETNTSQPYSYYTVLLNEGGQATVSATP